MFVDESLKAFLSTAYNNNAAAFLHEAGGHGFANAACGPNDKDLSVGKWHGGKIMGRKLLLKQLLDTEQK